MTYTCTSFLNFTCSPVGVSITDTCTMQLKLITTMRIKPWKLYFISFLLFNYLSGLYVTMIPSFRIYFHIGNNICTASNYSGYLLTSFPTIYSISLHLGIFQIHFALFTQAVSFWQNYRRRTLKISCSVPFSSFFLCRFRVFVCTSSEIRRPTISIESWIDVHIYFCFSYHFLKIVWEYFRYLHHIENSIS